MKRPSPVDELAAAAKAAYAELRDAMDRQQEASALQKEAAVHLGEVLERLTDKPPESQP